MPRTRELRLAQAINKLSKYYGQFVNKDTSRYLATRAPGGVNAGTSGGSFPRTYTQEDELLTELIDMLIDVSEGGYFLTDMVQKISTILELESSSPTPQATGLRARFVNYMSILSDVRNSPRIPTVENYSKIRRTLLTANGDEDATSSNLNNGQQSPAGETNAGPPPPQQNAAVKLIEAFGGRFNTSPDNPNKVNPNIGIILSHTPELSIHNRFTGATSIFLNGIPGIELSRAMPYLDVQMISSRPATYDNKLFAPSIYKFLLGAEEAPENTTLYQLQSANSSSNLSDLNGNYTILGMEAYLTPQTLAATNKNDLRKRSTEIFDEFRPLMSINDFSVTVQQSYAAYAYKTAKLSLTMHDRSRMAEVAELFRSDLLLSYTQFLIEFGWIHPDGELNDSENVYADIINSMRMKEKFRVTGWNFNMTDGGEIKVDLELVTVGQTNMQTDLVVEDGINVGQTTQLMSRLVDRVRQLRREIFERNNQSQSNSGESGGQQQEIRGIQFLDTASDAFHNISLTPEQIQQMNDFMGYLNSSRGIPNVSQLRDTLVQLYGNSGTNTTNQGATGQVRTTVEQQLAAKLNTLKKDDNDPFLIPENFGVQTSQTGRVNQNAGPPSEGTVSLGNLLLNFMGLSLAATAQFDEIQLIFYPFNNCAGYASRLNISNFRVDVAFFKRKYTDYVLSNLSRSGRMSIQQFWNFLIANILDDHGARSYGLFDQQGGLWRDPQARNSPQGQNNQNTGGETEHYDTPTTYAKLACLLRNVTPDGNFRMPQLGYYLETVPGRSPDNDEANQETYRQKTILRMHIYDQATDTRGGLSEIYTSQRNNALGMIPAIPNNSANEGYPATTNNRERYNAIIENARNRQLVEGVDANGSTQLADRIRWRGGHKEIKNFLYDVMPSIIYGSNGSTIKTANISSLGDPSAATINIVNAPGRNGEAVDPNGEQSGGLPLQVVPVEGSITSFGCPLITYGSNYFVDFGTGTTLDTIYMITGISHKVNRTEFSTTFKIYPVEGFGLYRNYINQVRDAARALNEIETARNNGSPDAAGQAANTDIQNADEQNCNTIATSGRPAPEGPGTSTGQNRQSRSSNNQGPQPAGNGAIEESEEETPTYDRTVTDDPTLVRPASDNLGVITGPNGFRYQITPTDVEWIARSVLGEGGSIGATLWTYAQRLVMQKSGAGRAAANYLGSMVQSFSQPINPAWLDTGRFCNPDNGERRNSEYCSENKINRRKSLRARRWTSIPDHIRRMIIDWAQGRLRNEWPGVVDFAAAYAMTSERYQERIRTDEKFRSGQAIYLTNDRARNYTRDTVRIEYNGPASTESGQTNGQTAPQPQSTTVVRGALGGTSSTGQT